jgi:hypothetical protein
LKAVGRLGSDLSGRQARFVELYTVVLAYFVTDPLRDWVPKLFSHGGQEARQLFASDIGHRLRGMDEARQRDWWQRWLKQYWESRLQGVPTPLEAGEIERMLDWLPHLTAVFDEAVSLAVLMPRAALQHSSLIHDLRESELPQQHPHAVAKLLIYLGESGSERHIWYGAKELIERLLHADSEPEMHRKLRELEAKLGL